MKKLLQQQQQAGVMTVPIYSVYIFVWKSICRASSLFSRSAWNWSFCHCKLYAHSCILCVLASRWHAVKEPRQKRNAKKRKQCGSNSKSHTHTKLLINPSILRIETRVYKFHLSWPTAIQRKNNHYIQLLWERVFQRSTCEALWAKVDRYDTVKSVSFH